MSAATSRRLVLVAALACIGLFLLWLALPLAGKSVPEFARYGVVGTPLAIMLETWDTAVGPNALFLGLLLLAQWAFLHPLRRTRFTGNGPGRPRWLTIFSAALVTAMLCIAAVATILEMPDAWRPAMSALAGWRMWTACAAVWAAWCVVFYIYFRRGDFLGRAEVVIRGLLRGSVLELLVAIPTHALVYRRSDCYCERGSYTGVVFGSAVLVWAFGPGLMLLYLREKQRRTPILLTLCPRCGASLDFSPASRTCPRCGHALESTRSPRGLGTNP